MDGSREMSIIWELNSSRNIRCSSSTGGGRIGGTGIPAWQACGQLQRMRSHLEFQPTIESSMRLQLNLS